jgi:SAM-dependent methyltransferase
MSRAQQPEDLDALQLGLGQRVYAQGDHVSEFASRVLRPVEVVILARYREAMSGRVLEVGCGAGRLLGYLVALGGEVHGIDVSERMVGYCRRRYPEARVSVGDMTRLSAAVAGPFDCIFASFNVLDVLPDAERRRVLADFRNLIASAGLLVMSSHNLAHMEAAAHPGARPLHGLRAKLDRPPSALVRTAMRLPGRIGNRRRLAPHERRAGDHAILNDDAFDYGLLHYYIRRDDQARQLAQIGYELVECLDLEGRSVSEGQPGEGPELHYVARRR